MKAHYSSFVPSITMSINIEELPRRDQWELCHHLMQKIGVTEAIYSTIDHATIDKALGAVINRFVKGDTAQKG